MREVAELVAAVVLVAWFVRSQVAGGPVRGKRLVLLPLVLTGVGVFRLAKQDGAATATDIAFLVVGALVAVCVGLGQGACTEVRARDGALWTRVLPWGLGLWGLFIASRVVLTVLAGHLHAHLAASTASILLTLGLNRLSHAAVVAFRAACAGIAFAPEKDGSVFLSGWLGRPVAAPGRAEGSSDAEGESVASGGGHSGQLP